MQEDNCGMTVRGTEWAIIGCLVVWQIGPLREDSSDLTKERVLWVRPQKTKASYCIAGIGCNGASCLASL
ncbi:Uncharacterized protein HZ326_27248 [Fusarium oxysporum f. sp. albedinis]|nr:Uncharacterized protein HZ326_27248 [Fusarium oxysporum f. sp. albedinis]